MNNDVIVEMYQALFEFENKLNTMYIEHGVKVPCAITDKVIKNIGDITQSIAESLGIIFTTEVLREAELLND